MATQNTRKQDLLCCLQNIPASTLCSWVVRIARLSKKQENCVSFLSPQKIIHIMKMWMFLHLPLSYKDGGLKHTHKPRLLSAIPSPGSCHLHSWRQSRLSPSVKGQIKIYSTNSELTSAEHRHRAELSWSISAVFTVNAYFCPKLEKYESRAPDWLKGLGSHTSVINIMEKSIKPCNLTMLQCLCVNEEYRTASHTARDLWG